MSLTLEEKIERLWDTEQCRKLMARYEYYGYGRVWEKVPAMFANRDDIWIDCEGFGVFDGMKGVETFFVDWHHSMEGDAKGMLTLHTLTTECIEVAEDGQTADHVDVLPGTYPGAGAAADALVIDPVLPGLFGDEAGEDPALRIQPARGRPGGPAGPVPGHAGRRHHPSRGRRKRRRGTDERGRAEEPLP